MAERGIREVDGRGRVRVIPHCMCHCRSLYVAYGAVVGIVLWSVCCSKTCLIMAPVRSWHCSMFITLRVVTSRCVHRCVVFSRCMCVCVFEYVVASCRVVSGVRANISKGPDISKGPTTASSASHLGSRYPRHRHHDCIYGPLSVATCIAGGTY